MLPAINACIPFLCELFGEFLDLIGLVFLLSSELLFLRPLNELLLRLPLLNLGKYGDLSETLREDLKQFEDRHPPNDAPETLRVLEGSEAKAFLALFPGWGHEKRIRACAIYWKRDRSGVPPCIYPSRHEPVASVGLDSFENHPDMISEPIFFERLRVRDESAIYAPGFFLMVIGSMLMIVSTILRH